jgi:hypothetical protein
MKTATSARIAATAASGRDSLAGPASPSVLVVSCMREPL